MDKSQSQIPSDLARAARALSQVSYKIVAKQATIEPQHLKQYERGLHNLSSHELVRLREALEYFGVIFIEEDEYSGYGVRQKFNSSKSRQIDNWEGEGGPAAEDDI